MIRLRSGYVVGFDIGQHYIALFPVMIGHKCVNLIQLIRNNCWLKSYPAEVANILERDYSKQFH